MNKSTLLVISLTVAVGTVAVAIGVFNTARGSGASSDQMVGIRSKAEIKAACLQHLAEADRKGSAAIDKRAADFAWFFKSCKPGAKPFSEAVVSLYGKWRAVSPYLPFADTEGHKEYVADMFARHIFTTGELASAVRLAVEGSVKDLESIENELAVTLRNEE